MLEGVGCGGVVSDEWGGAGRCVAGCDGVRRVWRAVTGCVGVLCDGGDVCWDGCGRVG